MSSNNKANTESFKVYVRPQSVTECFIVTMDPQYPFKICLYPSTLENENAYNNPMNYAPDELDELILHNYLILRRHLFK